MELVKGWETDEEGEEYSKVDMELRTFEDIDKLHVLIWIGTEENIGNRVIRPVVCHTWEDRAGTPIHPPQQKSCEEGVWHLCRIHVNQGEECRRDHNRTYGLTIVPF